MDQMEEVIAAFLDDERVDTEALKRALALPEGREYLVDLLAMRELVAVPIEPAAVVPAPKRQTVRRWGLAAAAAVLLSVSTAAGYLAGYRLGGRSQPIPAEAAVPAPAIVAPDAASASAPPPPTTVIRLQSGVDWTERSGGGN
jgi:hypothetical protein